MLDSYITKTKAAKGKAARSNNRLKAVIDKTKKLNDRYSAQETKSEKMTGNYSRLKDRYRRAMTMLRIKRERSRDS